MKQPTFFYASLIVAGVFLSSCGNGNKDFRYNNYTKVDSEAFTFLHKVYEESLFQEYAALNLNPKSQELATKYKNLANEVASLAIESNVILPEFADDHFEIKAGLSTGSPTVAPVVADSLATDSLALSAGSAPAPALSAEKIAEKVKHSQEEIAHELDNISRNTNKTIRSFGNEKLAEFGHKSEEGGH